MSFKLYTLPRFTYLLLAGLWLCCSCIDEFEANLPDNDLQYLVVEGSICGQSDCVFYLGRSLSLNPTTEELLSRKISNASLTICGSDNSRVPANQEEAGKYQVALGELSSSQEYWIEIEWEGRTYQSAPTRPLMTPDIADLHFEQPREDKQVDILITPITNGPGELQYFRWDYQEHWEIHTPYESEWEYFPENDSIGAAETRLNIGWCQDLYHPAVIGKNADFVNNEIRNMRVLSLDNMDNRFNWKYCITLTQRAISQEQFEYEQLAQRQSDDMGGLFTPQPSELPSNIKCSDGKSRAIGYIGVTLNAVQQRLYITRSDVGYRPQRIARILTDEEVQDQGPDAFNLYHKGFRVLMYEEMTGKAQWIERWGIDASAWGASFQKPDFWQ